MKRDVSLYEILEVSPLASALVIRAAYRCLAQFNHPDKNPGTDTAIERQSRLNRAYAVLSDPEQRRRYDQTLGPQPLINERRGSASAGDKPGPAKAAGNDESVSRAFAFRPLV